jgi:hypothetical protein
VSVAVEPFNAAAVVLKSLARYIEELITYHFQHWNDR